MNEFAENLEGLVFSQRKLYEKQFTAGSYYDGETLNLWHGAFPNSVHGARYRFAASSVSKLVTKGAKNVKQRWVRARDAALQST